jgi:hypothetical protein
MAAGEVARYGDIYLVGVRGDLDHNYDDQYDWTDEKIRQNNLRDVHFYNWVSPRIADDSYVLCASVTSLCHPIAIDHILKHAESRDVYLGKVVTTTEGFSFLSGAGILYSKNRFVELTARASSFSCDGPDDLKNGILMRHHGKTPGTRLDVFDSKHFLLANDHQESSTFKTLTEIIYSGYYHVRFKYLNPQNRYLYDPRLMLRVANFLIALDKDYTYMENCLNLCRVEHWVLAKPQ